MLKLPNKIDKKTFQRGTKTRLRKLLSDDIISVINHDTISKIPRLQIHGLHQHENLPGVCIVMSYCNDKGSKLGVTMDVLLVTPYKTNEGNGLEKPIEILSSNSLEYIKDHDLCGYLENDFYSLFSEPEWILAYRRTPF